MTGGPLNGSAGRFWAVLGGIGVASLGFAAWAAVTISAQAVQIEELHGEVNTLAAKIDSSKDFALRDIQISALKSDLSDLKVAVERLQTSLGDTRTFLIQKLGSAGANRSEP